MNKEEIRIITAAGANYYSLLAGLLGSLKHHGVFPRVPVTVLNVGLIEWQIKALQSCGIDVIEVSWDFELSEEVPESFKAMTARPHLPQYFPNTEYLVWLDADVWIQDNQAIEALWTGARSHGFAITKELDRSYSEKHAKGTFRELQRDCYRKSFGEAVASQYGDLATINVGVFAGCRNAPHWEHWATCMGKEVKERFHFFHEQTSLNYTIYANELPTAFLPATYNWQCNRARPWLGEDGRSFYEGNYPYELISILHLAADTKKGEWELFTLDGKKVSKELACPYAVVADFSEYDGITR